MPQAVFSVDCRLAGFVDDVRYCQVRVNRQKKHTQHVQGADEWKETLAFLVADLQTDTVSKLSLQNRCVRKQDLSTVFYYCCCQVTIKCKSKFLLTLQTRCQFGIHLCDYPLQHRPK